MKRLLAIVITCCICTLVNAQNRWALQDDGSIRWDITAVGLPHYDHIEMSGQYISTVIRYGVNADQSFFEERSLVFPMLRTIPNDTHASLTHRIATDIPSLLSINCKTLQQEKVQSISIHGSITVESTFTLSNHESGDDIAMTRIIFPSYEAPALCEIYKVKNLSQKAITLYIPGFTQQYVTPFDKGVEGSYYITATIEHSGTYEVMPGESQQFEICFSARSKKEAQAVLSVDKELEKRQQFISNEIELSLILQTPDSILDAAFRFAKLRAAESIYKTKGGYLHGPGGEAYYAAIWANDQAEYVNPFFPFLGYEIGNASALNAFRHFARYINDENNPIPSSIIAEGTDIWNGAGDRGDAAMIAYGATRYALARGSKEEAQELWPLITWCLEYCHSKLNTDGVVASDCDELEGRFPAGDANLCTSSLYYDALVSASYLGEALAMDNQITAEYSKQADALRNAIEKHFGKDLEGFHTYQYYKGNDKLRSWICIPLTVDILDRADGTISALFSDKLWHDDGLLTEQGDVTYWDRSTLYALRGALRANHIEEAMQHLQAYSERRLLGEHAPYPIEAYPEGSQRHLSAESGLYCRVITEGLFGIRPTGFKSFTITPHLPDGWSEMTLSHVKAFGDDFTIRIERRSARKVCVIITSRNSNNSNLPRRVITNGDCLSIKLP